MSIGVAIAFYVEVLRSRVGELAQLLLDFAAARAPLLDSACVPRRFAFQISREAAPAPV